MSSTENTEVTEINRFSYSHFPVSSMISVDEQAKRAGTWHQPALDKPGGFHRLASHRQAEQMKEGLKY
jgi:hypothetical protein